jgi:hypothetical protein
MLSREQPPSSSCSAWFGICGCACAVTTIATTYLPAALVYVAPA